MPPQLPGTPNTPGQPTGPGPTGYIPLSLATLAHLDRGVLAATVDDEINKAIADCDDRPHDDTARKVTLTIIVKPVLDATGCHLTSTAVDFAVSSSLPKLTTRTYDMPVRKSRNARNQPIIQARFVPIEDDEPEPEPDRARILDAAT